MREGSDESEGEGSADAETTTENSYKVDDQSINDDVSNWMDLDDFDYLELVRGLF